MSMDSIHFDRARRSIKDHLEPGQDGRDAERTAIVDIVADLMHECHELSVPWNFVEASCVGQRISDLRHYCFLQKHDWEAIEESANGHFVAEINGWT